MMRIVPLAKEEYEEATIIGVARQTGHPVTDRDSARTQANLNSEHVLGAIGERAFEKPTGWLMDRTLRRKGDMGIDFRYDGSTIDVKTRPNGVWPMLIKVPHLIEGLDHIYVHAWFNVPERAVYFRGWLYGCEVKRYSMIKPPYNHNVGYPNYNIEIDAPWRDVAVFFL